MTDIVHSISGYFYTDMYEYLYLVTDDSVKSYKFIFKEGKIYTDDGITQINANDFIAVIKKITSEFRNKILEHSAQLESYEKIYTNHRYFSNFIKKHPVLKYEIHKFQNKISHFYEALAICQNEQPALKKLLQNYTYEANIFKNVVNENAVKAEEIFNYIQNIRSEKINRNISIR
ncbi:magnesium transporter CorA family protein [Campylobacter sp. RM9328]|uniref:magnesium transporter CorA family protein n=1 Tax=Campylobacter sp. RM9328 TaxID=1705720 RepID=UPI0020166A34|nr:magnesium transporter CorA family protein [Campylobacter sp. RM9328]